MIEPRHIICALGKWTNFESILDLLQTHKYNFALDTQFSIQSANPKMKRSFEVNQDRSPPTMTKDDWHAIDNHSAVAYIVSPPLNKSNAEKISGEALKIIASLFASEATAVQSESAGLSHGKTAWLALAAKYSKAEEVNDAFNMGAILYHTWVQKGILDKESNLLYSIGMHLLGHRDIELNWTSETSEDAINWINLLGLYLLADKPTRPIKEGEGFRLDNERRKIISYEKCVRKREDSFQFNPYGYFRLT